MRSMTCLAAAFALLSVPATAATVGSQSGELMINSGAGFQVVRSSAEVASGAQIMVRNGTAVISYSSTCSVRVGPGRVWTVAPAAPCSAGVAMLDMTSAMYQQAPPAPTDATPLLIGGGALVIGGVIYLATKGDDDKAPASGQ